MLQQVKQKASARRWAWGAAVASLAMLASVSLGCGMFGNSEQTMQSSDSNPAAQGTVSATAGDNGNTAVSIRVKHLAPPSKLASDANVYVVWIKPGDAAVQNVGAMTLDDNLEGHLDTVTPHDRFKLMVTPEPGARGSEPTNAPVFTSDVERDD